MKKVLVTPAHYIVDSQSVSEYYYVGRLLEEVASIDSTIEYHVLCGKCPNKTSMPKNVLFYELYSSQQSELSLGNRIVFYFWILWKSTILSRKHHFDCVWHLLPNGLFSFNLFILLNLHKLFGIKKAVIGRLAMSYGEDEKNVLVYDAGKVSVKKTKIYWLYQMLYAGLGFFSVQYFKKFNHFIFYNKDGLHFYEKKLGEIFPQDRTSIIPVGFDHQKFQYYEKDLSSPLRLLYSGNLITRKRVDKVLLICQDLKNKNIPFYLDIVGDGYERSNLEKLAKELEISPWVKFHGFIKKEYIYEYYKNAHYLFLLSEKEAFGHVMLEAWSSGTIFIGSRIKVFEDMIGGKESGLLVDPENIEDIHNLTNVLSSLPQEEYVMIKKNALEKTKEYYWQNIARKYFEIITK